MSQLNDVSTSAFSNPAGSNPSCCQKDNCIDLLNKTDFPEPSNNVLVEELLFSNISRVPESDEEMILLLEGLDSCQPDSNVMTVSPDISHTSENPFPIDLNHTAVSHRMPESAATPNSGTYMTSSFSMSMAYRPQDVLSPSSSSYTSDGDSFSSTATSPYTDPTASNCLPTLVESELCDVEFSNLQMDEDDEDTEVESECDLKTSGGIKFRDGISTLPSSATLCLNPAPKRPKTKTLAQKRQEWAKLSKEEKRRQQNREAAERCRKRKKQICDQLEMEDKKLRRDNKALQNEVDTLRHKLQDMERLVMEHQRICPIGLVLNTDKNHDTLLYRRNPR